MEGICLGKGIVTGIKFAFGLFGYKHNKTAEKQGSFSSFAHSTIYCTPIPHGNLLFLSPDICRMVVPKRILVLHIYSFQCSINDAPI